MTRLWFTVALPLIKLTHTETRTAPSHYSPTVKLMHNNVFLNKYCLREEVAMATGGGTDSAMVVWICVSVLSQTPT